MHEQARRISELINKPVMQCILSQNNAMQAQRSSCLDVIEDTELAITAYLSRECGESTKNHYLAVYGLLQALFAQQDAVKFLCIPLGVLEEKDPWKKYPKIKKIREIRNDTIGHATKRGNNKPSFHFISRPTLEPNGFQHMSIDNNGKLSFDDVSIPTLISDQKTCLSEILDSVISELEQKEKAHKEKFGMEKLVSVFPNTLSYSFGKISEGIIEGKLPSPLALLNFRQITQTLQNFKQAIEKRGVTYDSINLVYKLLEYPMTELEVFFQNAQDGKVLNINEKAAYIFAFFVEKQFDELKELAQEIDEYYSG